MLAADVAEAQSAYTYGVILGTAVIAAGLSALAYRVIQAPTVAHEGTHALFILLMGGRVTRIHLISGGGETGWENLDWLGRIVMGLGGYLGPSIFGLLGAAVLSTGRPDAVLWLSVCFLALILFGSPNVRAFAQVLLLGGGIALLASSATPYVQAVIAILWVWWLLIGGAVGAFRLGWILVTGSAKGSDAHGLRSLTMIPATLWVLAFIAGTSLTLFYGGERLFALAS